MKTHKKNYSIALGMCALALAAMPFVSQGQNSIGVNFAGRQWSVGGNTPQSLNAPDSAGIVTQQNWNNVALDAHDSGGIGQISSPNAGVVSDNSGAATGLTFSYVAQGQWSVDQGSHTGIQQLMDGYSDVEGANAIGTYSLGNVTYTTYDVYVFVTADGNGRVGGVSINGGPQTWLATDGNGYDYSTPLIQATATTQVSAVSAHYVRFQNITGSSFQVALQNTGNNLGVAAIQIVDVSGTVFKPSISVQPAPETLYAGRNAQFTVAASGTGPFAYQWQTNSVNLIDGGKISGFTSNILTITDVSASDAANFYAVVTNTGGSTTSSTAQLTIVTPVNAYEPAVLSNNPVAYYRFNETGDPINTPNLPAFDYINGDNGIYGVTVLNSFYGTTGPTPADGLPGFESGNSAIQLTTGYATSQITIPSWPLDTNAVTLTAWIYPLGTEAAADGLIFNRGANVAGLDYSGSTDTNGNYTLGYTWNNDFNTYGWNSGLVPPANQWSFVALVVTPTNAMIYVANTNGMTYAVHTYPHVVQSFGGPIAIGNDPSDSSGGRVFNGNMDEVAVFGQALSQSQIIALFASASGITNFAPAIAVQPASQNPYAQENVQFSVGASGSQPLTYQWLFQTNGLYVNVPNGGRFSGATSGTLSISKVSLADQANYLVVVSNSLGSITSSPAALTVTASTYANVVLANGPIAYYSFSEIGDPASGGLTAYDFVGGFNGIYGHDVRNGNPNYNIAGPQPADGFPAFPVDNPAAQIIPNDSNGHIVVSPWNLDTNTITITCWIRPVGIAPNWSGLVVSGGVGGNATTKVGLNFSGSTDANGNKTLSYTWGDDSGFNAGFAPPTNQWSFIALAVTPTNATISMFNTNSTNSVTATGTYAVQGFGDVTMIGCDPYDASGRNFDGVIDEVAVFNKALSPSQVAGLYAGRVAPAQVTLTETWNGSHLVLSWPGAGVLQQASSLTGPWTANGGSSPVTVVPSAGGSQMFYRVQAQ